MVRSLRWRTHKIIKTQFLYHLNSKKEKCSLWCDKRSRHCTHIFSSIQREMEKKRNNICVTDKNEHKNQSKTKKKKRKTHSVCCLMKYHIISHVFVKEKSPKKSNCSGRLIYESPVLFQFKQSVPPFLSVDAVLFGLSTSSSSLLVGPNDNYIYFAG